MPEQSLQTVSTPGVQQNIQVGDQAALASKHWFECNAGVSCTLLYSPANIVLTLFCKQAQAGRAMVCSSMLL